MSGNSQTSISIRRIPY
uniref:Uncharacterized protein n=1 Tax=Amphimedon queenslandica TaxID=400682 RepID=A0A1X7UA29_AMPQE